MRTEAEIAAVRDFVRALNALIKSVRMYGLEHERVTSQIDIAWAKLQTSLSDNPSFLLGASASTLTLDTIPLGDSPVEKGLSEMLSKGGVTSIQFAAHVTQEEFSRFVHAVAGSGKAQPGGVLVRLHSELGDTATAGIRVNVTGDQAGSVEAASPPPMVNIEMLLKALDDPKKMTKVLSPIFAAIPEGQLPPMPEPDAVRLLRLIGLLQEAAQDSTKAKQVQQHLNAISPTAKAIWKQSLEALAEAPAEDSSDQPLLARLGTDLSVRYAVDGYQQNQFSSEALPEIFQRLGKEISALGGVATAGEETEILLADAISDQFWEAAPADKKRETLLSSEAWCVPAFSIKPIVNQMVEAGESQEVLDLLLNYTSCILSPNPATRRRTALGIRDIANLYASTFSEALEGAFEKLLEQMQKEDQPELKKLITDALLQVNTAATAILKPTPGSVNLSCMTCKEELVSMVALGPWADTSAQHEMPLYCLRCGDATLWSSAEADRRAAEADAAEKPSSEQRSGDDRRNIRRVRMKLAIRVRSEAPGQDFTVVGDTINISRTGVLFLCQRLMPVGLHVLILMPYDPGEELPESKARVVRCQQKEEDYFIALHFEK